jgi:hypothetical protein
MVEMEIDGDDIDDLRRDFENYTEKLPEELNIAMEACAERIKEILERITPKNTGLTAISWTVIPMGMGEFVITNDNEPIATFLSEGTVAHRIPSVGYAKLHWVDEGGEDRFASWVWHPGTQPLYLEDSAMLEAEPFIEEMLDAAEDAAWREVASE